MFRMISLAAALGALLFAPAVWAQEETVETEAGTLQVQKIVTGLVHPWGLAFLPEGGMLVTERPGRLRHVAPDGTLSDPLGGLPDIFAQGQGGLLDVALDPDFKSNRLVYLSFAEPGQGGASTAVARATLGDGALRNTQVIFRQEPKIDDDKHFGGRLVFAPDGTLFVTLGERFTFEPAQDPSNHLGAVVRIEPDGSVPDDNPFAGKPGGRPEIWSYGHRNIEAAAIHPETGALWIAEMGPRNGDELNRPEAGRNYGWPVVSWGQHYDGQDIPDPPTRPEFADAVHQWTPVISPSGMDFYTANAIPEWTGSILIGGLSARGIVRLEIGTDQNSVAREERVELGVRIRNVAQGPDGAVYALTDEQDGKILRLTPPQQAESR